MINNGVFILEGVTAGSKKEGKAFVDHLKGLPRYGTIYFFRRFDKLEKLEKTMNTIIIQHVTHGAVLNTIRQN